MNEIIVGRPINGITSEVINKFEVNDEVIAFLAKVLGPLIEEEFRKEDAKNV